MAKTVALNLVCHNEIDQVQRVIKLVQPYLDEFIVVNDGPPLEPGFFAELNEKPGFRVSWTSLEHRYPEPGRQLALALTESDWVFVVDCDEEPELKLLSSIRALITRRGIGGYWVWLYLQIADKLTRKYQHLRLFRKVPLAYWSLLFHSFPEGILPDHFRAEYLEEEDGVIFHRWTLVDSEERQRRYSEVGLNLLVRYGDIPSAKRHIVSAIVNYPGMREKLDSLGYL